MIPFNPNLLQNVQADPLILPLQLPGVLRRELTGQILEFERALDNDVRPQNERDQLTLDIRNWVHDFKHEIGRNENLGPVQEEYIARLKELLIDAIMHAPLDEDCLLGTDGLTYGNKALLLYMSKKDLGLHYYHAPRFSENPFEISVSPHPIAPMMVRWLKDKEACHPSEEVERAYENAGVLPVIPTAANERIRCMRENLIEQRLKRELITQLQAFGDFFESSPFNDRMTTDLREWQRLFLRAATETNNTQATQKTFVIFLQEILRDPITMSMLDEETLLGSDGVTYSKKALLLYISNAQMPYRNRSPKFPNNPAVFTVSPNPVAARMIAWLKSINQFFPNPDLDEIYQELVDQGNVPELPTEENVLIAQLREQAAERERQIDEQMHAFGEQDLPQIFQFIDEAFEEVHQQIDEDGRLFDERLGEMRQNDHEQLQVILAAIDRVEREALELHGRVDQLRHELVRVDAQLDRVQALNTQLTAEIAATRAALKDRDKGWISALLTTVAIIGCCALATVVLQGVAAQGLTIKVAPFGNGGMMSLSTTF